MLCCNSIDSIHITGITEHMHRHDGYSLFCNQVFNFIRVDIERIWLYITKNWCTPFPFYGTHRCDPSKRCRDDLPFQTKSLDSHLESNGTISYRNKILDAELC